MKKVMKVFGILAIVVVCVIGAILLLLLLLFGALVIKSKHDASIPIIPEQYQTETEIGGTLEKQYLANGPYATERYTADAPEPLEQYQVYYPKDAEGERPLILYCNGSGVHGTECEPLFRHWASWGFIVAANEETRTASGEGILQTLAYVTAQNADPESPIYGRVNMERIGITGHSQGGVSVFHAITHPTEGARFTTAVPVSPTHEELAEKLGWGYDVTKVTIPTLLLAGMKGSGEMKTVLPIEAMQQMFDKIPAPKVMARKLGCEHNDTDSAMDGYVTAWFLWQLSGDETAGTIFRSDGELMQNPLYTEQRIEWGSAR